MYDVAIIGAGPAGSTLARLLGPGLRVLLADPRTEDAGAGKLCGGLLAPAAQKELARQGLGLPGELAVGPQLFAVRTVDGDSGLERRYQRHYVNIDRTRFDGWLAAQAAETCDYRSGWRLTDLDFRGHHPLLTFSTPQGTPASCTAKQVVGADGAASLVRLLAFGARRSASYVAIQGEFSATDYEASYGAYFSTAITDHYAWTIPKGDSVLVGAALPRGRGAHVRFERLLQGMRAAGFGFGDERGRFSAPVVRPLGLGDIAFGSGSVALVGEAAGLISPSSAEGISYALRSAASLAQAFAQAPDDPVARYRRLARPLALEVTGKVVKARVIANPSIRRAVMASGVGALNDAHASDVTGSLVELLLP